MVIVIPSCHATCEVMWNREFLAPDESEASRLGARRIIALVSDAPWPQVCPPDSAWIPVGTS